MSARFFVRHTVLPGAVVIAVAVLAGLQPPAGDNADDVFGLTNIWKLHLTVPAAEYQAMQPPAPAFPGLPGQPAPKPRGDRETVTNLFGTPFPWAHAALAIGDTKYDKVGVRYDGDGSYLAAARNLKRPLRVDLARFGKQDFHGLKTLNLRANALDPTRSRDAIGYAIFRAAGAPAPRTAFVEVALTVPGKYDGEYVGLYTLVEEVDEHFLQDRFGTGGGLLLTPWRLRGIDYLGDDWDQYTDRYRPSTKPSREQAKRVIEFARLIEKADDDTFRKEIASYLDVDLFLRFLAASSLTSSTNAFVPFGVNYHLYLHPETNKFVFLPGELDSAFGNAYMLGSPEQQMDLSIVHPHAGENKLVDRLLADEKIAARYRRLVGRLTATAFTKARLFPEIDAVENAVRDRVAREAKAVAARKEPPVGFGQPAGPFGGSPGLRTFVEKRTSSVAAQLAGRSKGYVPRLAFGPPGGPPAGNRPAANRNPFGGNNDPVTDQTVRTLVTAPDGFEVKLYAAPPKVAYPVAVCAAASGDLFVAVDERGSLGKTPGGGKLLRCVDVDGDGKADEVNVFARMEHPRGVIYQDGTAWVLHPPFLTAFTDTDGDGVADKEERLVSGLTTDMIDKRGGDHTTNGIRMGIDGWIYIAVGDYGIRRATGKDGATISHRGGGIVRVRPDGTELELFATGLRNPFDIAIDPRLDLFTRDNTNDGAGWDARVSHLVQTAEYGYTQLYANFPEETMPPLGSFGGGGGTGALWVQNPAWPESYRDRLYTGDWGRSEVYRHTLADHAASFDMTTDVFLKIPRPTGMDIDHSGNLYVASWRGGEAAVYVGPQVGFIARVAPRGLKRTPFPDLKEADADRLVGYLAGETPTLRLHAQRELLCRGRDPMTTARLVRLAADGKQLLPGRVAAVFTFAQLDGKGARGHLLKLAEDPGVAEFALRALTDRKAELEGHDAAPFVKALRSPSPRVQAQALVSLARLGDATVAKHIIPLTTRPDGSEAPTKQPLHAQPDPERAVAHLAVRALVALDAADACLEAIGGPHSDGALLALRDMHTERAVEGLIARLGVARSAELRQAILATLIRLYHREADNTGTWWGIRPDSTGPYFDPQTWPLSDRIGKVIATAVNGSDPVTAQFLRSQLTRHQVSIDGLPAIPETTSASENERPIVVPKADPNDPDQIGNMTYEAALQQTLTVRGDPARGKVLFAGQSCVACHTSADGQTPKGPHLVDIGKRYNATELVESILQPGAKIAQGYESYTFALNDGRLVQGFVVSESAKSVLIREGNGLQRQLPRDAIESRFPQNQSLMPTGIANNLTPGQLADLIAYLQSLE